MSNTFSCKQRGLSLVELMIAMALGLLLVAATTQVFMSNSKTFSTVGAVTSLQDGARYATYLLSKDLRTSGFSGCISRGGSTELANTLNSANTALYDFGTGLTGYNDIASTPAALSGALTSDPTPKSGTDILIVRGPTENPVNVSQTNSTTQVFTEISSIETQACDDNSNRINGICAGDIVLISDCAKAKVFQAGALSTSGNGPSLLTLSHPSSGIPGNNISSWGSTYADTFKQGAQVVRISTLTYYIADNPTTGVAALYRKDGNAAATLVVDGVQDMQITYGIDTSGDFDTDSYVLASNVPNWNEVLSVRLQLHLISSEDNVIDSAQSYTYNGSTVTAGDKRLHYPFTTTIALRNRVP